MHKKKPRTFPGLNSFRRIIVPTQPAQYISAARVLRLSVTAEPERQHIRSRKGLLHVCYTAGLPVGYLYVRKQVEYHNYAVRINHNIVNVGIYEPLRIGERSVRQCPAYFGKSAFQFSFGDTIL
jgi:hypothetical protein